MQAEDLPVLNFTSSEAVILYHKLRVHKWCADRKAVSFFDLNAKVLDDTGLKVNIVRALYTPGIYLAVFFEDDGDKLMFMLKYQ